MSHATTRRRNDKSLKRSGFLKIKPLFVASWRRCVRQNAPKLFPGLRSEKVTPAGQLERRDMSGNCQKMPGRLFLVLVLVLEK